MVKKIYAVRDAAMEMFNDPFVMPTDAVAVRAFGDHVNTPGNPVNAHPEHYVLYLLGSIDLTTGAVTGMDVPMVVITASSLTEVRNHA